MNELIPELEEIFTSVTAGNYPMEWDENHVTFSLMREMRALFPSRTIRYRGFEKTVSWISYKNKGKTETRYGDISLLINIQFTSGEKLTGVAFLEAKRDSDRGNFDEIRVPQLERIVQNAPYAHLLLYAHSAESLPIKFPDDSDWKSHIWASPVNTALPKLRQCEHAENAKILRVCLPFSMLLTSRFFWGLDLDYRKESIELAINGLPNLPAPQYLGIVNIFYRGQAAVEVALPDNWEQI
jgi:hypothetical protein